jgi:regulation of enolase protein 1 (concanavalin A-like superfamily)
MKWLNEPSEWKADGGNLSLTTEDKTDFWQASYYGWRNDNGHFYYREVEGEFTAEAVISAGYGAHYDQAGLMLRTGRDNWIKAGVEFAHGRATLSSVFTTDVSDWAIGPQVQPADRIHLRLTHRKDAVCVQWMDDGKFQTLRLGSFATMGKAMVGPMACSPTQGGLTVAFEDLRIGSAVDFASEV